MSCCCIERLDIGGKYDCRTNENEICVVLATCMKVVCSVETMESVFGLNSAEGAMGTLRYRKFQDIYK